MTRRKFETVRGTGNVFRDLGRPDAELRQFKALLAAEIVLVLDEGGRSAPHIESPDQIQVRLGIDLVVGHTVDLAGHAVEHLLRRAARSAEGGGELNKRRPPAEGTAEILRREPLSRVGFHHGAVVAATGQPECGREDERGDSQNQGALLG